MIKLLILLLISLYFGGCGADKKNIQAKKIITDTPLPKTQKPKKTHNVFELHVESPNAERIRILNIKPKYKDGIRLKKGKYLIEVSAKKHITYNKWIDLHEDTTLAVVLHRKKNVSMGFIHWKEIPKMKYIAGSFWEDQALNKQKRMTWEKAVDYCKDLSISVNENIIIDDFMLPTAKELASLRSYTARLDYSGSIYWSSSSDEEHPQFAKYVYINKNKSGWYNKSGKSFVRCVSHKTYPLDLSVEKLANYFMKKEHFSYLDAYEFAVDLKYGKPVIKNIINQKHNTLRLLLRSQKYDKNKNYFYYKEHTVKRKKGIAKNPEIKFEIINNKLVFREIN